jgi:hypothetical protein
MQLWGAAVSIAMILNQSSSIMYLPDKQLSYSCDYLTSGSDSATLHDAAFGGGGICCSHSHLRIIGNTIQHNHSGMSGGGISSSFSSLEIRDNEILYNIAMGGCGGGIVSYNDCAVIIGNKIISNHSDCVGGILSWNSRLCTGRGAGRA